MSDLKTVVEEILSKYGSAIPEDIRHRLRDAGVDDSSESKQILTLAFRLDQVLEDEIDLVNLMNRLQTDQRVNDYLAGLGLSWPDHRTNQGYVQVIDGHTKDTEIELPGDVTG